MAKKKHCGLTRPTADKLVADLLLRIPMINAGDQYLYGVERIELFGSYLTSKEKLGDLDVAVLLYRKEPDDSTFRKLSQDQQAEAPAGSLWLQQVYWCQEKVFRALRAGHKAFSFHDYSDLSNLKDEGPCESRVLYLRETDTPATES